MSDFWIYFQIGFRYILNTSNYTHLVFLLVVGLPYIFRDWKKILILVTLFTASYLSVLFLSFIDIITVKTTYLKLLSSVIILFMALYVIMSSGKGTKNNTFGVIEFLVLFFGAVSGFLFSGFYETLVSKSSEKIIPMFKIAVGIESAQIVVISVSFVLALLFQNFLKFSRRDWIISMSFLAIGMILPSIIQGGFLNIK